MITTTPQPFTALFPGPTQVSQC